jgi:hypothetical protein
MLLSKDDLISFSSAKKAVNSKWMEPWRIAFSAVDEETQIYLFQNTVNLAMIFYVYGFASWTLYLMTTVSGISKLQKVLLQSPIYAIPFFASFYTRGIVTSASGALSDLLKNETVETFIQTTFEAMGVKDLSQVKNIAEGVLDSVVGSNLRGLDEKENIPVPGEKYAEAVPKKACWFSDRDSITYDDSYITEFYSKLPELIRQGTSKQQLEMKTRQGTVCLKECKRRAKLVPEEKVVRKGLEWCSSDCAKTLGSSPWCYVEEGTLVNKKRTLGKPWAGCDPQEVSATPTCYSGYKYRECDSVEKKRRKPRSFFD